MTFLIRRVLLTIPVLLGVSTLTFFLLHMIPGDPVDIMLGDQAAAVDKAALRSELGLDRALSEQYVNFLMGLPRLDLGKSLHSKRPVADEIFERLPATIELSFAAMALAILIGVPTGVWAATRQGRWLDRLVMGGSVLGLSVPSFWLGPMLILVFAIQLDFLPVSERGGLDHLVLPSLTLSIGLTAVLAQMTRASVLTVLREDYIRTARAKGASPLRLYFRHALQNALMPLITVVGLQFGALLTGTVIIETIFDWPGVGTLLYQAIQQRNYPVVQGCVLLIAFIYVLVNFITDLAYSWADPQVRIS